MEKAVFISLFFLIFKPMFPADMGYQNHMMPEPEVQYDGPYVHYEGRNVIVKYIMERNGVKTLKINRTNLRQKNSLALNVMTDIPGKSFRVSLKKELKTEKSEFPAVERLLVLSDIEGNFGALRKLLQVNNVIDDDFNWKFGESNVVFVGDFFDRGQQVTEVLWFIYYLEEQAKSAGGHVHFILGNHEIMNLSGDLRYVPEKYLENARVLDQQYVTLYNENSELGRWLRTKNIVEKIGDIVFVHGGISANINKMNISIPDINNLSRPYYADSTFNYTDKKLDTILGDMGPVWYRGYYQKNKQGVSLEIDSALSQYGANHIITGHTIVSNTISVWYNGKLLNTDVHHAEGKSETLLIENNKFYRVNAHGEKVLLIERT